MDKVYLDDFIGVFEGAFSDEFCDKIVRQMDRAEELGYGVSRQHGEMADIKTNKDDFQIFPSVVIDKMSVFTEDLHLGFRDTFWNEVYPIYSNHYDVLKSLPNHTINGLKLQKTRLGQGYHVWHSEHSSGDCANRMLVFTVYLNDVEEGGETEFLFQHKRVRPKKGTCVVFPAGFTHTHRGNPPLSNNKYIITGWLEY